MTDVLFRLGVNGQQFGQEVDKALDQLENRARDAGTKAGEGLGRGARGADELALGTGRAAQAMQLFGPVALGAAGAVAGLGMAISAGVAQADRFAGEQRKLEATLRAAGGAAGVTGDQIRGLAEQFGDAFGANADSIREAATEMASIGTIAPENFRLALEAAQAFEAQGLKPVGAAATALADELGDPIKALKDLEIAGVAVTMATADQARAMIEAGDRAGAQRIILQELRDTIGSPEQQGLTGVSNTLANAWGGLMDAIAQTGPVQTAIKNLEVLAGWVRSFSGPSSGSAVIDDINARTRDLVDLQGRINALPKGQGYGGGLEARKKEIEAEIKALIAKADAEARAAEAAAAAARERRKDLDDAAEAEKQAEEARKRAEKAARDAAQAQAKAAREAAAAAREYARELAAIEKAARAAGQAAADYIKGSAGGLNARDIFARQEADNARAREDSGIADVVRRAENNIEYEKVLSEAGKTMGKAFRSEGLLAAEAMGQILGGKVGGLIQQLAGALQGVVSGDFTGVGGPLGGVLTLGSQLLGGGNVLTKELDRIFGKEGAFSKALANAGIGVGAARLTGGSGAGGALGGSLGGAFGSEFLGSLGKFAGPVGSVAGGILGGLVGGLLKSNRTAGATLTNATDDPLLAGAYSKKYGVADDLASSVQGGLRSIADALGVELGDFRLTIGQRGKDFRVNTSGGSLKTKNGAVDFNQDADAAVAFAIRNAIEDGALKNLTPLQQKIIDREQDIDAALSAILSIQSVGKELAALDNPLKAARDALGDWYDDQLALFKKYGEDTTQLVDLYNRKKTDLETQYFEQQLGGIRSLIDELTNGDSAGLTDQADYQRTQQAFNAALGGDDARRVEELAQRLARLNIDINASSAARFTNQSDIVAQLQAFDDRQVAKARAAENETASAITGVGDQIETAVTAVENATVASAELIADTVTAQLTRLREMFGGAGGVISIPGLANIGRLPALSGL